MQKPEARAIQDKVIAEAWGMADEKRESYTKGNADVLFNFKEVARRTGSTKYQVWLTYFSKHIMSVEAAISKNPDAPIDASENMRGRLKDIFNYDMLLVALLEEDKLL